MSGDKLTSALLAGGLAGLAGTAAMMAFRSFDKKYAPRRCRKPRKIPANSWSSKPSAPRI